MKILIEELCPECGEQLEIYTSAEQLDEDAWRAFDEDPVRCPSCGWESVVEVSNGEGYIAMYEGL